MATRRSPRLASNNTYETNGSSNDDHANDNSDDTDDVAPYSGLERSLLPNHTRSQAGISLRAFLLGLSLSLTSTFATYLASQRLPVWRAPFFISLLSLFHFLEYYMTARYNTPQATIHAFLLASNGAAYNIAHASALIECLVWNWLLRYRESTGQVFVIQGKASLIGRYTLMVGFVLVVIGQITRSLAANYGLEK